MSGPVRLLMTTDAVGGVWTYAVDLAATLASRGYETTLAVLGPPPTPEQRRDAEAAPGVSVIETALPLDWMATEPAEVEEAGAAVHGLALRIGADLIHLNSPALAAGGRFAAPVVGACHSCVATWWSTVRQGPMPEDFRWRSQVLWRGLIACDALIAPTAAFANATARTHEVPRPHVVHNGRAPDIGPAGPRRPIVFTSGRLWDEGKNIAVLQKAAARAETPVYAAGPIAGPNGARLQETEDLRLLGPLSPAGVRTWLRQASIYASSAVYEPFGLGVLEAAQAGCALVLSDIPTFRELWDGAAVFVDPRSPPAFAAAFERLAVDGEEARRLGQHARTRAVAFSVDAMADGVNAVYAQVLGARAAPRRREAAA